MPALLLRPGFSREPSPGRAKPRLDPGAPRLDLGAWVQAKAVGACRRGAPSAPCAAPGAPRLGLAALALLPARRKFTWCWWLNLERVGSSLRPSFPRAHSPSARRAK